MAYKYQQILDAVLRRLNTSWIGGVAGTPPAQITDSDHSNPQSEDKPMKGGDQDTFLLEQLLHSITQRFPSQSQPTLEVALRRIVSELSVDRCGISIYEQHTVTIAGSVQSRQGYAVQWQIVIQLPPEAPPLRDAVSLP